MMGVLMYQHSEQLTASRQFIETHDDFLVVSHVQPDGDAASSTCAIGLLLSHFNKRYVMINDGEMPVKFSYLSGFSSIVNYKTTHVNRKFKYVISIDCADYERIGQVSELFTSDVVLLNIDHHRTNTHYGTINLINDKAGATVEVLFELLKSMNVPLSLDMADCIYTGLLTDTGGFRYANTSSNVMHIASKLIDLGVNAHKLAEDLLESVTLPHIHLLRQALNRLSFSLDNQICWLIITLEDVRQSAASNEDFEGIVNYARNIEGVEVGILFKELDNEQVKVSFRSAGLIDVAKFAQSFGGGGHTLASGATVNGSLNDVIQQVIPALEKAMI